MHVAQNVNDWERLLSIAAGVALVAVAVKVPRLRGATGTAGIGLIARGTSGVCPVNGAIGRHRRRDDTRAALGGSRGIHLQEEVLIRRPVDEVYAYWRALDHLPEFMQDVERVDVLDDTLSHWVLRGPGGQRLEWDAEIINEVAPRLIGWRSLPGADVATAGSVQFRAVGDSATAVSVTLQYDPPGGKVGASLAWLTGHDPDVRLRADLLRLKDHLEHATPA